MKKCTCCGQLLPHDCFQVRKASKDGLTASCKTCLKERDAKRYLREREARIERHKLYVSTDRGRQAHAKAVQRWRANNADRRAAQVILGNAVRDGRVIRWPVCAIPECDKSPEAHHPDYGQPLQVVWLCAAHHKQAHALTRAAGNDAKRGM